MAVALNDAVASGLLILLRESLALVLALGGVGKLANLGHFAKLLRAYDLLPAVMVRPASVVLPILEVSTGGCIAPNSFTPVSEYFAAGLFTVFMAAVGINLLRGRRELPCACFGNWSRTISWHLVARNSALVGLALVSTGRFLLAPLVLCSIYAASIIVNGARASGAVTRTAPAPGSLRVRGSRQLL